MVSESSQQLRNRAPCHGAPSASGSSLQQPLCRPVCWVPMRRAIVCAWARSAVGELRAASDARLLAPEGLQVQLPRSDEHHTNGWSASDRVANRSRRRGSPIAVAPPASSVGLP
jgi:hypothetical protein